MRKWIALVILLAVLGGVDIGAKAIAEDQIEVRAQDEAPRGAEVSVSIESFPFLGRLGLLGSIDRASIELRNVPAPGLDFARVHLDLRGVEFDRGRLVSAQEAEILGIDRGFVTIEVTQEELSEKLSVPVTIAGGEVRVSVAGRTARVDATVVDGVLELRAAAVPAGVLRVAIPKTNYAPCVGRATLLAGRVRFTCAIDEVPPALLGAANRAANR